MAEPSTRTVIVIPWRHNGEHRRDSLVRVQAWFRSNFPDLPVILADDPSFERFNRAAARNEGVRVAESLGAETVVLCDADTLCDAPALKYAIAECSDGRIHLPYTKCYLLHADETVWLSFTNSTGGVYVFQPATWWRAGGQDTRFEGWGFEDTAFWRQATRRVGPFVRHDGIIECLWHPTDRDPESEEFKANQALYESEYLTWWQRLRIALRWRR